MTNDNSLNEEAIARKCVEICEQHKASDILLFDVREKTILADFVLVCSGTSLPHLRAIAESIRRTLLDEETVGELDDADIIKVDLIVKGRDWDDNGQPKVKAFCRSMYVTIEEDEFAAQYLYDDDDEPPFEV